MKDFLKDHREDILPFTLLSSMMSHLQNSSGERCFPESRHFFENGGHETTRCILDCRQHKIQRRLSQALIEHHSRYLESIARRIISQLNARSRSADGEPPAFCCGPGSEAGRGFYSDAFVRSWSSPRRPPGFGAGLHCQGGLGPANDAGVARPSLV